jgi:hypothetical protein
VKTRIFLKVDGFVVRVHSCLLEGFTQSWMSVTGPRQIFGTRTVFNGNHGFGDHLTGIGTNDVSS